MKQVKDHYFHQAKKEGYVARSVYKLQEIDRQQHLLKQGDRVMDLGCSPGSWLQYSTKQVGSKGEVFGIDIVPVTINLPGNVTVIQADIYDYQAEAHFSQYFDIILSDMAPKTMGVRSVDAQRSFHLCEQALNVATLCLKSSGSLLIKAFQGGPFEELRREFQKQYQRVKICKPKSSRQESVEIFLLGQQKKQG